MKSTDGCWTCRLRRKKCDEVQPVCRGCSTLQITCYYDEKPGWMDGGDGQKKKAEEVKREVRSAAARRRGAQLMDAVETSVTSGPPDKDAAHFSGAEFDSWGSPDRPSEPASYPRFGDDPSPAPSRSSFAYTWSDDYTTSTSRANAHHSSAATSPGWNGSDTLFANNPVDQASDDQVVDRGLVTFYLDHFFPFLFPFYRPPLLEGGRSWVMQLIMCSKAMWHTTLCLSAYFLSVALDSTTSGHELCKTLAWEKLLTQTDATFKMLQHNLQEVRSSNTRDHIVETSRIMGSVIQLQRFEISVGNFENCQTHLNAAMVLFRQILQAGGDGINGIGADGHLPTFHDILNQMGKPPWTPTPQQSRVWGSDQAAFRFFSALLIVDDIIASTFLGEPPGLHEYHTRLLTNGGSPNQQLLLNLEEFVGCENWVMLQIGEIAALDAWKKSLRRAGRLDMMELVARAMAIKQVVLENLARIDAAANTPKAANPVDTFALYNSQLSSVPGSGSAFVTRIWAHATLLYLSVVVSGWQPGSASIRENVEQTLELLAQMPTPGLLRTMAWPFCITGCLVEPSQEGVLRSMVEVLVPLRVFGTIQKALEIMENIWRNRDAVGVDTWDFAACFSSLEHLVLLV